MNNEILRGPYIPSYRNPTLVKGSQCGVCSAMKPKEIRRYDSCPQCGKSLFAIKTKRRKR